MDLLLIMRKRTLQLIISAVLIIQLFNFSIDTTDRQNGDNLSANEIESFLELWVEIILGNGNILQETDESDDCKGKRDNISKTLFITECTENPAAFHQSPMLQDHDYLAINFKSRDGTINTPPPRSLLG